MRFLIAVAAEGAQVGCVHIAHGDRLAPLCGARPKGCAWQAFIGAPECERCCARAGVPVLKQRSLELFPS